MLPARFCDRTRQRLRFGKGPVSCRVRTLEVIGLRQVLSAYQEALPDRRERERADRSASPPTVLWTSSPRTSVRAAAARCGSAPGRSSAWPNNVPTCAAAGRTGCGGSTEMAVSLAHTRGLRSQPVTVRSGGRDVDASTAARSR